MGLDGSLDSERVNHGENGAGQACAEITDLPWSVAAGHARVDVEPATDGAAIVRVAGELDVASAPLVENAIQVANAARRHRVRLDLSAVHFCDCAGLSAFLAGDRLLRAAGGELTLSNLSAPVRRLLTLTGMHRVLAVDPPRDE